MQEGSQGHGRKHKGFEEGQGRGLRMIWRELEGTTVGSWYWQVKEMWAWRRIHKSWGGGEARLGEGGGRAFGKTAVSA